ncbi:hypothetical protein C8A05DRAFT_17823 [Staphylotrichum tortipilum]|uniref:Archaemetzincin-2 n=1 Tax=Staphylotrichum tortipilum TaxID=2831512 RepID=A0AAN6MGP0_9PEZI|nr:hypothetical protein C8A05DRAFT_17823 [Staphylotrichum longicolle]
MPPTCHHDALHLDVSPHAADVGFTRPPLAKRAAAATPSGRALSARLVKPATGNTPICHLELDPESLFPGPLVLPGDGLSVDPKEPPQSLRSWNNDRMRNHITSERNTIYVAPTPSMADGMRPVLASWAVPSVLPAPLKGRCNPPDPENVRAYLEAFYHPLPVKLLPANISFVRWTDAGGSGKQPRYIGLQAGDGVTRITTRPCPDETYPRQLSLNDILDTALEILPNDAYALVMLTDHDLYEDEDDDFCCGRAYGNDRIAVVSSARYHPLLDEPAGIELEHMWPFSHCEAYVTRMCKEAEPARPSKRHRKAPKPSAEPTASTETTESPMARVIQAGLAVPPPTDSHTGLWLSRMARTVSHEVGHCFCLDHCSYYACVMQGTAGIVEDVRQPPYLCLVCLAKLGYALAGFVDGRVGQVQLMLEQYVALAKFCDKWKRVAMFAAYGNWLEQRITVECERHNIPVEYQAHRRQTRPLFT